MTTEPPREPTADARKTLEQCCAVVAISALLESLPRLQTEAFDGGKREEKE